VELRQLNYHYPDSERPAVHGLNLRLEPGQHLGLAGPDGSGKTSLLRLLAGHLDGYTGVVAYNGTALRDIAPERLSRMIADTLPGQELFSGSVLDNLTLGQDHLHIEEVAPALALVNLRDELYALPQGLATEVGPASALPDSTRQKLVLARALLHKPQLLLLDGLLPAVSPAERYQILDRILDPAHNWTVIVATGDEAVLKRLPNTLRLESGRVISNSV
jgi:ABC-type bacteriocin/lantibiotic exporter with double-glycine peptidase domain